jgi:excisionase family DNA binding protein
MTEEEPMLTVEQVAKQVQAHPKTVRKWLREGRLHGIRPGGDKLGWRIAPTEVRRFLGTSQIELIGLRSERSRAAWRRANEEAHTAASITVDALPIPDEEDGDGWQRYADAYAKRYEEVFSEAYMRYVRGDSEEN